MVKPTCWKDDEFGKEPPTADPEVMRKSDAVFSAALVGFLASFVVWWFTTIAWSTCLTEAQRNIQERAQQMVAEKGLGWYEYDDHTGEMKFVWYKPSPVEYWELKVAERRRELENAEKALQSHLREKE